MKCDQFGMLVQRYHDGELGPALAAEYENHMRTCDSCRALDGQVAGVFDALGDIGLFGPSEGFDARVLAQVNIARYRVSPARKAATALGRAWRGLPAPVRAAGILTGVFGLFVTIYSPIISMMILGAGRITEFAGSVIMFLKKVIENPEMLPVYLSSLEKYRVAAKILLKTIQREVPGFTVAFIAMAVLAAAVVAYIAVRMARTAWKKGETHVAIL